jgi:hypothetical protein
VGLRKNAKIELIKNLSLFSSHSKDDLAAVGSEADELVLPKGRAVATQGARRGEFVVLVDGSTDVSKNGRRINQLGSGDFLGEIPLTWGALRTATAPPTPETRILALAGVANSQLSETR